LNLDEFNAACWSLTTDEDRLLFLAGFLTGLNNGNLVVNQEVTSRVTGFKMGQAMRLEAEAFRITKTEIGKLGGRPNKPSGSPQVNQDGTQSTILNLQSNTKNKRMSRGKKIESLDGYPEDALFVVRSLLHDWPAKAGDRDILFDPNQAAVRVVEIMSQYPDVARDFWIKCGKRYLSTTEPKFVSALHFFFGPGKGSETPKWKAQAMALKHEEKANV